ncbi:YbaK/EbsC family protein [Clostridium brassicae]|uniref:YbaK/EbsC family protein n=1 Tax=Clostridium brassicae TaxID=2999072 RepID=A0ABT4D7R4_9CLOT|nr:YbaK/EbsC family protein [Clostridium brassicae]MCY6958342.1 YbaK/EbsC family protein [Clostridium brassicae]
MSITKVKDYFKSFGVEDKVIELDQSSATVELAAEAIGCDPERIAKTLSFLVDGKGIVVVVAGDAKIDNRKYREEFHEKAKMIPAEEVETIVGHAPGGVCPFAINEDVEVYLDISLKRFSTVYPAAGSGNSAIKLNLMELEKYSNPRKWVDVCKCWIENQ